MARSTAAWSNLDSVRARLGPAVASSAGASRTEAASAARPSANVERGRIGDSFSGAAWPGATRTLRYRRWVARITESRGFSGDFPALAGHARPLRRLRPRPCDPSALEERRGSAPRAQGLRAAGPPDQP